MTKFTEIRYERGTSAKQVNQIFVTHSQLL